MTQYKVKTSKEVADALAQGTPIVALESTIISHGMPYPQNLETALKVESVIREHGAVPATVAIIKGVPTVGCTEEEIEYLAKAGTSVTKVSRRDIPIVTAMGLDGATTVSATMILSALAGIKVFATGGIGGVHRGAETTMDISADLEELAKTNVNVVCAGAKSILDLGLTREYLETKGVPVIGYRTDELPAFYTRKSGYKVDYRLDTPMQIARAIKVKDEMSLGNALLIVNPIPEEYSMDENYINSVIEESVETARKEGVVGKAITPYLLERIQRETHGESLKSNIELVMNNVILGAEIAKKLAELNKSDKNSITF